MSERIPQELVDQWARTAGELAMAACLRGDGTDVIPKPEESSYEGRFLA